MKAILSPCLFFPSVNTEAEKMKHSNHLLKVIDFIDRFLDLELDKYSDSPYDRKRWYVPNFEYENLNSNLLAAKIFPILLRILNTPNNLKYGENGLIINNDKSNIQNKDFILPQNEDSFLRYLTYLKDNQLAGIFFLGLNNQDVSGCKIYIEDNYSFDTIKNPWIDESETFNNYINKNLEEEPQIFANRKLCVKLDEKMKEEAIKITGLKGSHYKKYGEIIALRNGFEPYSPKNPYDKNTNYYRRKDKKYIISVDLLHGHFEVFQGKGKQLWIHQYNFSGIEIPLSKGKTIDDMRNDHRVEE